MPSILQEVQVPIIENQVCQDMFETAGHTKTILSSFLCAGYANGQRDSCEVFLPFIIFHNHTTCSFISHSAMLRKKAISPKPIIFRNSNSIMLPLKDKIQDI